MTTSPSALPLDFAPAAAPSAILAAPDSAILLVDLSSIAHPIWHTSASEPDPNAASIRIVARVRSLALAHPHAAICVDSGRSFRAEVDPAYKANRPESDAVLHHQIALAIDALRNDGFPIWAVKGFEADDVIATAVARAMDRAGASVVIASADKDLLQLVNPRVRAKSIKDGSLVDEDGVFNKFGVLPFQMRDYLTLCGDASDNIKGAQGIGPKKAAELLALFVSLDSAYAAMDKGEAKLPAAVQKSLVEFRPRLETVRKLVTMRADVPIDFDQVFKPRVPLDVDAFDFEEDEVDEQETTGAEAAVDAAVVAHSEPNGNGADHGQALAIVDAVPVPWERQLEPRSMKDAQVLAKHMHDSRLFSQYGSPPAVLGMVLAGRELGMPAMASLRAFHVIEGKPTLSADLIRALVIKSGLAKYFRCTERTAERATFVTKRGDDPEIALTFTVQEGRQAFAGTEEKWKNSGWGRNPADLCVARASSKLARLVYPEVTMNLYAQEEFDV